MRNFINICEEDNDSSWEREKHIENMIRYAFDKAGLQINYNSYSVSYTDEDRMAVVRLEGGVDGISLNSLLRLKETGLADDYHIDASDFGLEVKFRVHPDIDHARIA